jgi:hypothetical protein
LLGFLFPGFFNDGLLVGGEAGAFVEQGADLALELAEGSFRPDGLLEAFVFVEGAFPRIVDAPI